MGKLHFAVSYRGFSTGARLPGGQLLWLVQVSRSMQAPSRRLPGTSHTSWYFCLRFYTLSTAEHCHGAAPTATCAPDPGKGRHNPAVASHHGAAPAPAPASASRCSFVDEFWKVQKLEDEESQAPSSQDWVLLGDLIVDTAGDQEVPFPTLRPIAQYWKGVIFIPKVPAKGP